MIEFVFWLALALIVLIVVILPVIGVILSIIKGLLLIAAIGALVYVCIRIAARADEPEET